MKHRHLAMLIVVTLAVMVITDYNGPSYSEGQTLATDLMVGNVQAYFKMVNQGTITETLDVRFPLGGGDGYNRIYAVEDFSAYVDGKLVQTTQVEQPMQWGTWPETPIPWATWQVTFPPGRTVNLGVDYEVRPEGWSVWGTFTYILETGAGWYGPIGEGTVVFRLPHEVSALNVATSCEYSSALSSPNTCDISGTDIKWHFSDIEPTQEDNIHFTVLAPSIWRGIQRARDAVQTNPDSLDAQLRLAHACREGLEFKHGLTWGWALANEAETAYDQVIKLAPNSTDMYVEYLEFLLDLWFTPDPTSKPEQIEAVLAKALAMAPGDSRLMDIQSQIMEYQQQAEGYQTQWASILTYTPTLPAEAMQTLSPSPSLTMTPIPQLTMSPTFRPTDVSVVDPPTTTAPITLWAAIGAVVIGGAGVGVWLYRKGRTS